MSKSILRSDTDLVSRLGCMRRNTVVANGRWGTIEHVELWVPPVPALPATRLKPVRRGKRELR